MNKNGHLIFLSAVVIFLASCVTSTKGNDGNVQSYTAPMKEAPWIRSGEPIEFEDELWFPQDGVESLLDSEVIMLGEYKNVQVFVDRVDVRPYSRLYTKFGKNKFRYFKRKNGNDQSQ